MHKVPELLYRIIQGTSANKAQANKNQGTQDCKSVMPIQHKRKKLLSTKDGDGSDAVVDALPQTLPTKGSGDSQCRFLSSGAIFNRLNSPMRKHEPMKASKERTQPRFLGLR